MAPRDTVRRLVELRLFQNAILALIAVNAIVLGLETSGRVMAVAGPLLLAFDNVVLVIFAVEIALRIWAHGFRFFRDPWSVFDFVIVMVTLVPAADSLLALRALRVFRALRLVSAVPRLRRVVGTLLHAIPGVASIGVLLLLVFYVFSVVCTNMFAASFPHWFGSIGSSMYTLFQIMTLESWSMGIVRPVMDVHPWAWMVFVPFIVLSSFTVLNLVIAVIIDSIQALHREEEERGAADVTETVREEHGLGSAEYRELREELSEIRRLLEERRR